MRVDILQVFHHQRVIGVHQNFAVPADQEGIAHAAEIKCVDAVGDRLECQVGADDAEGLPGFFHCRANGNDHLPGDRINVRLGQAGAVAVQRVFVPGAAARIEAVRHFAVGADGESALGVTEVHREERAGQRFLLQQAGDILGFRIEGEGFTQVFSEQDASAEPSLNVVGRCTAHFTQIAVQIVANGIALQVIVVQRK